MHSLIYSSGNKSERLSPRLSNYQRRSLDLQRPSSQLFNSHRRSLDSQRPRPSLDSDNKSLFNLSDSVLAPDNHSDINEYDFLSYKIDNIAHHIEKELVNIADKLEQINLRLNLLQGALENDIANKSVDLAKLNKSLTKAEVTNTADNPSKTIYQDFGNSNSPRIDKLDLPSQPLGYPSVEDFILGVQKNLPESCYYHFLKKTPSPLPPPSSSPSPIESYGVNGHNSEKYWIL